MTTMVNKPPTLSATPAPDIATTPPVASSTLFREIARSADHKKEMALGRPVTIIFFSKYSWLRQGTNFKLQ